MKLDLETYMLTESINDKGILKAIFMGGTPGAGKSYVTKLLRGGVQPRVVNSDTWINYFDASRRWSQFKDKIDILTEVQLSHYLNSLLPLWVDSTSGNPTNVLRRHRILYKEFGYNTGMIWVNTSLETAIRRTKEREAITGRYVDEDFIREAYERIGRIKPKYRREFKEFFIEVDNEDGELNDEVLTKLYRATSPFWNMPNKNEKGRAIIGELERIGGKYLSDIETYDMNKIKQMTKGWFNS